MNIIRRLIVLLFPILIALTFVTPTAQAAAGSFPGNPYGFTETAYSLQQSTGPQIITDTKAVGASWLRIQEDWALIETSPGVYDWSRLDSAVSKANAGGLHSTFVIRNAPSFHASQICYSTDGTQHVNFPTPSELAAFATTVATRYDGKTGHGKVDGFEVGNEEYDNTWFGSQSNSLPCRQPQIYAPTLKAGYQAIKAVDPTFLVGMFGMWWRQQAHIQNYMSYLSTNGYGQYMDYANFHYYHECNDPNVTVNSTDISLPLEISTMYSALAKPIWITEMGWAHSCANNGQQMNMQKALAIIHNNNTKIAKVMWYTDYVAGNDDSITNGTGTRYPAWTTYQNFIAANPNL